MKDAGYAHMGIGRASGKDKATIATQAAISSPLLETTIAVSYTHLHHLLGIYPVD